MDFSKRLRLFLTGIIIGSVVMYFFVLKDSNIYKGPKEVIKGKLTDFPTQFSTKAMCQIKCYDIDTAVLRKSWNRADIQFNNSKVHEKPCPLYEVKFSNPINDKVVAASCSVCDDFTVLQELRINDTDSCQCP